MAGSLSHEYEVAVPATEVWEMYRGLKLGRLVYELLPHVIEKVELVEGDGGVGTILNVIFPPGVTVFTSYKEKFTRIDDDKRIKDAEIVEGGYLELGFSLYRVRFEIIEKEAKSCTIKSTIDYEVATEYASNASLVSTMAVELISKAIGKYLTDKKNLTTSVNVVKFTF